MSVDIVVDDCDDVGDNWRLSWQAPGAVPTFQGAGYG